MFIQTMKNLQTSFRALLVFTILTGFVYPLMVTVFGASFFPRQASGSLVMHDSNVIGSELIAQKFTSPRYFHARPSAVDYATIPSGASNYGPTSEALKVAVLERRALAGVDIPVDLLTTSGSGLDPDITPEAARFQIGRILSARSLSQDETARVEALINGVSEGPQLGFLGKPRVNVLKLNLALDQKFP